MEELYKENARIVYYFLYSRCHNHQVAEDLTQETFLRAWQSIDRYNGDCKVSVWLCQIAKHLLYQYWQKNRHEIPWELEMNEKSAVDAGPEHQVLTRIELLQVLKDMQKLPEQMREVMYLRIAGDLSFKEIGEIMGKSENWSRVTFYRGKERLLKGRMKDE